MADPLFHLVPPVAEVALSPGLVRGLPAEQHPDLADREIAGPFEGFDGYGGVDPATATRARAIALVKSATLAVVPREAVAAIGWRALVELGVAKHVLT